METSNKIIYEAPSTLVIKVKTEAAILQVSGDPQYHGFGSEETM